MKDWNDYRYLLAVTRHGSLSAAARAMNVSQPTVARRINQLEKVLDIRLFEQMPDGMRLTETGGRLCGRVQALEKMFVELDDEIVDRESDASGPLTVTTSQLFAVYWLADRIEDFGSRFSGIQFNCIATDETLDLSRREADIAIRFERPESSSMIGSRLGHVRCGIYGSGKYLAAHGHPENIADLADHRIVETGPPIDRFAQIRDLQGHARPDVPAARTNCSHTYIRLAQADQGLVSLPCYAAEQITGLEEVLAEHYDRSLDVWLLTHPALRHSARVRVFLNFIKDEFSGDRHNLGCTSSL